MQLPPRPCVRMHASLGERADLSSTQLGGHPAAVILLLSSDCSRGMSPCSKSRSGACPSRCVPNSSCAVAPIFGRLDVLDWHSSDDPRRCSNAALNFFSRPHGDEAEVPAELGAVAAALGLQMARLGSIIHGSVHVLHLPKLGKVHLDRFIFDYGRHAAHVQAVLPANASLPLPGLCLRTWMGQPLWLRCMSKVFLRHPMHRSALGLPGSLPLHGRARCHPRMYHALGLRRSL